MINAALSCVQTQRKVSIIYHDGDTPHGPLDAIPGETLYETGDGGYQINSWQARDFLIEATDLADLSDGPDVGHYILETAEDGTVKRYDVMAPTGERCWRWLDPTRQWMRVHTKQTNREVT